MSRSLDRLLPPLDLHAHVDPIVTSAQLASLRPALVFAVTRTLDEAQAVSSRSDTGVMWGCGVHPGLDDALAEFDLHRFRTLLKGFPFVGEIGLDRKMNSRIAREVLEQIAKVIADEPVIASVHSIGQTDSVLEVLE